METPTNVVHLRKPFECEICGSRNGGTQLQELRFDYGKGNDKAEIVATVPVDRCNDCGEEVLGHGAEAIRHEAVCRHLGVLTPLEIRELRRSLGLSRDQLATLTAIGSASIARWESGTHIQNAAMDRYLRLLSLPDVVARLKGGGLPTEEASLSTPRFRCLHVTGQLLHASRQFSLR